MHEDGALEDRDELDLKKYFGPILALIRRRKSIVLGTVVAASVVVLFASLLGPRQFTATATVMVPEPPAPSGQPQGTNQSGGAGGQVQVAGGFLATIPAVVYTQQTYARLLTSSVLIEKAANKLNLHMSPLQLAERITATPIRDTRLVQVTVRDNDPRVAANIADELAASLVEYDRQVISVELTQSREFLQSQLAREQASLRAAQRSLDDLNERENIPAVEVQFNQAQADLSALRAAYDQNLRDLSVAQTRLAAVKQELALTSALRTTMDATQANDVRASVAAQLRAKLADLTATRASMLQSYTSTNPQVVQLDAKIRDTQQALADASARQPRSEEARANDLHAALETQKATLEVDLAAFQAKDRLLFHAIPQREQELGGLNSRLVRDRSQLSALKNAVERANTTTSLFSDKYSQALIAEGMKQGFVRVVDHAIARPVPKGTARKVTLAALFGVIGGTALAFVADHVQIPMPLPFRPAIPDEARLRASSSERKAEAAP